VSEPAQRYWDDNAAAVTFTHPLDLEWLADAPKHAHILDYGCGYGRTLAELAAAGWRGGVGVDFSAAMIERGRRAHPELDLRAIDSLPLADPDGGFDLVLLFAVLTTIPGSAAQRALMAELRRVTRPGGLIYLSDYLLQTDARHLARYEAGAARHGVYGIWDRGDGGTFRHHTRERLAELLEGFDLVAEREVATTTLSGAGVTAIQILGRRRGF
jgi:SAM-dependent methyltransferase